MQFKTVHYSALINLGNYNNEKIGLTAQIEEGETPEQVVEALRQEIRRIGGSNADELYRTLSENRRKLESLNRKIQKATQEWNQVADFLRTQGIKPEAVDMPKFTHLLPEVKDERVEVTDGEIEEDEDDAEIPY